VAKATAGSMPAYQWWLSFGASVTKLHLINNWVIVHGGKLSNKGMIRAYRNVRYVR
jgi:hypothetical protein